MLMAVFITSCVLSKLCNEILGVLEGIWEDEIGF